MVAAGVLKKEQRVVAEEENHNHAVLHGPSIFSGGTTKLQVGIKYAQTLFLGDGDAGAKWSRVPLGHG